MKIISVREGRSSLSMLFVVNLLIVLAMQLFVQASPFPSAAVAILDQTDIVEKVMASTEFYKIASCTDLPAYLTRVQGIVEVHGDIICDQPKVIRLHPDAAEVVFIGGPVMRTKGITFEIAEGKTMWFAAGAINFEASEAQTEGIFRVDGNLVFYAGEHTYKAPPESKLMDRNQLVRSSVGAIVHGQGESVMRFTDSTIAVVADNRKKSAAQAVARAAAASIDKKKKKKKKNEHHHHQRVDAGSSSTTAGPPSKEATPDRVNIEEPRRQQQQLQQQQQQQQESSPAQTPETPSLPPGTNINSKGSQHQANSQPRQQPRPRQPDCTTNNPSGSTTGPPSTTTGERNFDDDKPEGARHGSDHSDKGNHHSNNHSGGDGNGNGGSGTGTGTGTGTDDSFRPPEMPPRSRQSLKVGESLTGFLFGHDQASLIYSSRSDASLVFAQLQDEEARQALGEEVGSSPPPGTTLIASNPRKVARAEKIRADILEEDEQMRSRGAGGGEQRKGKMATVQAWLPYGKAGWLQTRARKHARQHMGEVTLRITERGVLEGTLDGRVVFRKGGRSFFGWRPRDASYEAWVSDIGVEITRGGKLVWSVTIDAFTGSRR